MFHSTASNFFFVFYYSFLFTIVWLSLPVFVPLLWALCVFFLLFIARPKPHNISIINNQPKGKRNDNIIQICFLLKCQLICFCCFCCSWWCCFFRNCFSFRHSWQAVDCIAFCHNKCSLGYIQFVLFCFVLFWCFKQILSWQSFFVLLVFSSTVCDDYSRHLCVTLIVFDCKRIRCTLKHTQHETKKRMVSADALY